jgi:ADP-ribose diphosphatase
MNIETLNSQLMYSGHAFNVRRDEIRYPSQQIHSVDIVQHVGAVTILPLDADGRILFVRQYRHAVGLDLLELPAGTLDPGEQPEATAHREIREETGFAAGKLFKIGEFFLAPGYSTEYMVVYFATDLKFDPKPSDPDEIITVEPILIEEAYRMALDGELQDGKSLAALLLARPLLLKT